MKKRTLIIPVLASMLAGCSIENAIGTDFGLGFEAREDNTYKVTFKNYDGAFLDEVTVKHGGNVEFTKGLPSRDDDSEYRYTFAGWDANLENITQSFTTYAVYDKTNFYYVQFLDSKGKTIETDKVLEGDAAVFKGTNPEKTEDDVAKYTFYSWDKDLNNVHSSFSTKPIYDVVNKWKVTFVDWDGRTLYTDTIYDGEDATFNRADPTRSDDSNFKYTFAGWDMDLHNVHHSFTATAIYEKTNYYYVSFTNWDGSILDVQKVLDNSTATYRGVTPTRSIDERHKYTFKGWSKSLENVHESFTTQALFNVENYYYVTFMSEGKKIKTERVLEGGSATAPTGVVSENQLRYTFNHWDRTYTNVLGDITVNAVYSTNEYAVTFKNYNGSTLYTSKVVGGDNAIYNGSTPTKPDDVSTRKTVKYHFTGWDKSLETITQTTVFTAQFAPDNYYKVDFVNYDGTIIQTKLVQEGQKATYTGTTPTRPNDYRQDDSSKKSKGYVFSGWNYDLNQAISNDLVITAQYNVTEFYKVDFANYDGTILETKLIAKDQSVSYTGVTPTKPSSSDQDFSFDGWDLDLSTYKVFQDVTVHATYRVSTQYHFVNFKNDDGTIMETKKVIEGQSVTYTGATPTKPSDETHVYSFSGWDRDLLSLSVDSDLDIIAQYNATNIYRVDFVNYDGTILQTKMVVDGDHVIYDGATPVKPNDEHNDYTFNGWDRDLSTLVVGSNLTIAAQYVVSHEYHTVRFLNWNDEVLETQRVSHGGSISAYSGNTPTKPSEIDGVLYRFTGWSLDINLVTVNSDYTITAQFEEATMHNVTFDLNGGSYEGSQSNPVNYHPGVDSFTLVNPKQEGKVFLGWTGSNGSIPQVNVTVPLSATGDLEYYANWADGYQIDYDLDGGHFEGVAPTIYDGSVNVDLIRPVKEGYRFMGWTGSNGFTPQVDFTVTTEYFFDLFFKANWEREYTVTLNLADGILNAPAPTGRLASEEYILPDTPTKDGYVFAGWTGSNGETPETSVTVMSGTAEDTAYTANWKHVNSISYNLDSGIFETPAETTIVEGESYTLPNPTKAEMIFLGWTGSNGETPQKDLVIIGGIEDLSYTANWLMTNSITYNLNGGTFGSTSYEERIVEGGSYTLPTPTRNGYNFIGWTGSNGETPETTVTVIGSSSWEPLSYTANWEISELYSIIDNAFSYSSANNGKYTSTNKTDSTSSSMTVRFNFDGSAKFYYGVSSESTYDKLIAKHYTSSGSLKSTLFTISGTTTSNKTVSVQAGEYIIFTYSKDGSVSSGSDEGWVYNISLSLL